MHKGGAPKGPDTKKSGCTQATFCVALNIQGHFKYHQLISKWHYLGQSKKKEPIGEAISPAVGTTLILCSQMEFADSAEPSILACAGNFHLVRD